MRTCAEAISILVNIGQRGPHPFLQSCFFFSDILLAFSWHPINDANCITKTKKKGAINVRICMQMQADDWSPIQYVRVVH